LIEKFGKKTEARLAVFTWIEAWYNPHRRHKGIQQMSPNNYERMIAQQNKIPQNDTQHHALA